VVRTLRRLVFRAHGWLGLHLALAFGFMFLTGAVLVFGNEIGALRHPGVFVQRPAAGAGASLATIAMMLHESYPATTLLRIERQPAPGLADRSFLRTAWGEEVAIWTDPGDARVLAATRAAGFQRFVHDLHESLLTPAAPLRIAVSALAPALLVMLTSGLVSYRRFWRGFWRLPPRDGDRRRRLGALHRLLALWSLPFLLVAALTGSVFFLRALGLESAGPPPAPVSLRATAWPADLTAARLAKAEDAARSARPDAIFTALSLPAAPADALIFEGYARGATLAREGIRVSVDPATLAVLGVGTPADRGGTARIEPWVNALHYGRFGGGATRALWLLSGLGAAALALAGALLFAAGRGAGTSPARTIWRGLGALRWLYVLALIGALAMAGLRFATLPARWVTVPAPAGAAGIVALAVKGVLREGAPLRLRLRLLAPEGLSGSVAAPMVGAPARLRLDAGAPEVTFTLIAGPGANPITVTLTDATGAARPVTFTLGPPVL